MKTFEASLQAIRQRMEAAKNDPWQYDHSKGFLVDKEWNNPLSLYPRAGANYRWIADARACTDIARLLKVIEKLIKQRDDWIDDFGAYEQEIKDRENLELAQLMESGE